MDLVDFETEDTNNINCVKCIKCVNCNEYYVLEGKKYCSSCELAVKYLGIELSEYDIMNLPVSDFKREKIEENITIIYGTYKKVMGIANRLITRSEFNILVKLCFGKTAEEIHRILSGKDDFPACVLSAKQADTLFWAISSGESIDYKYVHAIGPFILDVWNCETGGILECYYKDVHVPNKCPYNLLMLHRMWIKMSRPMMI